MHHRFAHRRSLRAVIAAVAATGITAAAPAAVPTTVLGTAAADTSESRDFGDRTLRSGDKGSDVAELQRLLGKIGIDVEVTGTFDAKTKKGVQRFQRAAGFKPSGAVGKTTARSLRQAVSGGAEVAGTGGFAASSGPRPGRLGLRLPVERGMHGQDVRVLQDFLTRAGYRTKVDGEFGSGTVKNLKRFERANGLPDDGHADANDIAVLRGQVDAGPDAKEAEKPLELGPGEKATVNDDGLAVAPASAPQEVKDIIAAGNKIAHKPYIYGGGHGKWEDKGYDCSGSVSYALHAAGLLESSMPSGGFTKWGESGAGKWVTIYANAGHMYMVVAGLRFDTSGMKEDDGSRWHSSSRPTKGYKVRHPKGL